MCAVCLCQLILVLSSILRSMSVVFFFYSSADHRYLHSFPTRRSSDLRDRAVLVDEREQRRQVLGVDVDLARLDRGDRKSTRLNSSHVAISYAVLCLKKKTQIHTDTKRTTKNCPYIKVDHERAAEPRAQ